MPVAIRVVMEPIEAPNKGLSELLLIFEDRVKAQLQRGYGMFGTMMTVEVQGVMHLAQAFTVEEDDPEPEERRGNGRDRQSGRER